jgi:hypothetical protein
MLRALNDPEAPLCLSLHANSWRDTMRLPLGFLARLASKRYSGNGSRAAEFDETSFSFLYNAVDRRVSGA